MSVHSPLSGLDLSGEPGDEPETELPTGAEISGERDWDAEARVRGWKPLPADPADPQAHEFSGDPAKWTDSRTFVLRAETHVGMLREQNNRLADKLRRQEKELERMRTAQDEQSKKIDDLLDLAKTAQSRGYRQARAELEQQQREALRNGDEATFDKISEGLKQIDQDAAAIEKIGAKPVETPAAPAKPQMDPAISAFAEANSAWWNRDNFLTQQMIAEHLKVVRKHPAMPEAQRLDIALKALKANFPGEFGITPQPTPPREPAPDPVEDMDEDHLPAPRRNTPSVATPRAAPDGLPRGRSPFERIPQADREEARTECKRLQVHDSGLTAEEYVETYLNPHADIVAIQAKYRSKK